MAVGNLRTALLRHWYRSLDAIDDRSSGCPDSDQRAALYRRVLRYLIDRYQDERHWSRFAASTELPPQFPASIPRGGALSTETTGDFHAGEPTPRVRSALRCIRDENRKSYESFGIFV